MKDRELIIKKPHFMIKFKAFILFLFICFSCKNKSQKSKDEVVCINIEYKGNKRPEKLYLKYYFNNIFKTDSITFIEDKVSIVPKVQGVTKVTLEDSKKYNSNKFTFYIDNETTTLKIVDSFPNIKIENTTINTDYNLYQKKVGKYYDAFKYWNNKYGTAYQDDKLRDSIKPVRERALKSLDSARYQFVKSHPDSWFSLEILNVKVSDYSRSLIYKDTSRLKLQELKSLYNELDSSSKNSPFGTDIKERLDGIGAALVGNPVTDFVLPELGGEILDTKHLKGKVYLIDFWGSWCVYCRKGHPHLKELYKKYKPKGFEIVAISVEYAESKEERYNKWTKAIKEDQLPWKHVLNDNSKINLPNLYGVQVYPTKLLVDRNGKIILRVTDDKERKLDKKLAEIFDK